MSSYEFWDELGRIFNAVVAYQEKNLEFNKRFISPWIRLGNVFEKQDRNKEAMQAYERAIEIDAGNPQNWYELGNIHFKMENYPDAVSAFNRAIGLDASFGWAYNNLALTLAAMGETEQAVTLYQKAIDLLQDAKDKAVAWNRLGNAYRKLNQYEQALEAFHRADELDRENSGFRDNMDEPAQGPTVMARAAEDESGGTAQPVSLGAVELIAVDSRLEEEQSPAPSPEGMVPETSLAGVAEDSFAGVNDVAPDSVEASAQADPAPAAGDGTPGAADVAGKMGGDEMSATEPSAAEHDVDRNEETVTVVVHDSTQTFTETLPIVEASTEMGEPIPAASTSAEASASPDLQAADIVTSDEEAQAAPTMPTPATAAEAESVESEETNGNASEPLLQATTIDPGELLDPAPNSLADQLLEAEPEVLDVAQQVAYEAFLKDTGEPMGNLDSEQEADGENEAPGSPEPVAKIDEGGELQIEMDTKNAHVWNELGNVYFNTAAFDDAIVAYSKAIELDRWFAWPYSNLALAYVQKRRFVEAILLYQRSIELFATDKDKAISWNRLGNVYRRLNDYENAIAAYQRADALDPDNSTLSLQSRFSLLGNYAMEQKASYVS